VDYLQKPINRPELLDAIQKVFHTPVSNVPLGFTASSNSKRPRP
jgi:FixJ family two-component response regulator